MGSYFGSKATSGLCQAIIALMPPHDTYIETHLGGGAIMQRKPPALRNIGIDLDARALKRLRCDYPVEKVHGCAHRFLAEYPFMGRELLYCDPPYLLHTRTSGRRYRYDYEGQDHVELLALLKVLSLRFFHRQSPGMFRSGAGLRSRIDHPGGVVLEDGIVRGGKEENAGERSFAVSGNGRLEAGSSQGAAAGDTRRRELRREARRRDRTGQAVLNPLDRDRV